MLNPLHLRTLSVVLRAGSFAAAGRQLGYTGSAVSQQMVALEAESGLTLFLRGAHGIRPTPAAEMLSERGDALRLALLRATVVFGGWHPIGGPGRLRATSMSRSEDLESSVLADPLDLIDHWGPEKIVLVSDRSPG